MNNINYKEVYDQLKTDLPEDKLKYVEEAYKDDFKEKVKYIAKNYPRNNLPGLLIYKVERITVNNFQALVALLMQLKEAGLYMKQKPFIYRNLKKQGYLVSLQRTDRKYIDVFREPKELRDKLIKDIKDFEQKIKLKK